MKQLPHFLCIGAQKAGTSWLFEQLRQHPDIWLPPVKELHYFDHLFCQSTRSWSRWHIKQCISNVLRNYANNTKQLDFSYVRYLTDIASEPMFSEVWYEAIFQRPGAQGKIIGDITPKYCAIGPEGIRYVKQLLGPVKLIWIIRDPVARALSQLRMETEKRRMKSEISVAEWLELAASDDVLCRGAYLDYIPQWLAEFDKDAILFIPFKHIATQPKQVLTTVEAFIGVSHYEHYSAPEKKVNATAAFTLPEPVIDYFSEQFHAQYQFLHTFFNADFVNNI